MNASAKLPLSLLASCALASGLHAATIFSDDFSDNNSTGWLSSSTSSSDNIDASSGALLVNPGRSVTTHFSAATLQVGDSISLGFDVSFSNPTSQNGGFRFGLFDSNGSAIPTDNGNTAFTDYLGYIVTTNPAAASGTPVVFRSRLAPASSSALITSTGAGIYETVGNSGGSAALFPANTFVHVNLGFTRTETGLDLAVLITSGETTLQSHSISAATPSTFSYDALSISGVTNLNAFTIDNVNVNFTPAAVPEPASFAALAGLGMLALVATRRRRA